MSGKSLVSMNDTARHAAAGFVGWLCAALSLMTVILGAAPFTPALMALAIIVPVAALAARRGQFLAAMVTALCVPAAIAASPVQWSQFLSAPAAAWLAWVVSWTVVVVAVALRGRTAPPTASVE